jgi:hypothetical protein
VRNEVRVVEILFPSGEALASTNNVTARLELIEADEDALVRQVRKGALEAIAGDQ